METQYGGFGQWDCTIVFVLCGDENDCCTQHVTCVGLNNFRNKNFTLGLGRTRGKIICIPNGNTHRWWHDSELSIQLSVIVPAMVYCEFSCNVDHTCYLMQTQTFSNLWFQPMSCALRPLPTLTITSIVHLLLTYTNNQLQELSLKLSVAKPESSYDELDAAGQSKYIKNKRL